MKMYFVLLIWIYMSISVIQSQNLNCEDSWYELNGRCYYFSEDFKLTRDEALSYCRNKGSSLVSVPDEETNDFVYSTREMNDYYWIGLRPFDSNNWGWNNGNVDTNIPWVDRVPTDDTACARFINGKYYSRACPESHKAVCERETTPNDTTKWRSHEEHWYYLLGHTTAMSGARTCILMGGYLVRPTTHNERTFVTGIYSNDLWTGLTRLVWDDGTGFNWNKYTGGNRSRVADHPDNASCVALDKHTRAWKDKGCATSLRFICATAPATTTTVPTSTSMIQTTEESTALPTSPTIATSTTQTTMSTTTTTTTQTSTSASKTSTVSTTTDWKASLASSTDIYSTSAISTSQYVSPTVKPSSTGSTSADVTPSGVTQSFTISNPMYNEGSTESSVTNDSVIAGTQISSEYKALEIVLFVIYTLVVIMIVTDLVLLMVYLKWKKSSESKLYDAPANTDDNDIDRYDDIPRLTTSDTTKEDIYVTDVESTYANSNAPIYAVPNKIIQHHSSQL